MAKTIQQRFTVGELDPKMISRADIEAYFSSVATGTNVVGLSQGGFTKRPGDLFIEDLEDVGNSKLIEFQFNTEITYMLLVITGKIRVYKNRVFQAEITDADITNDIIPHLNWTQSADTALLFHEDLETKIVTRMNDTTWTIDNAEFLNIPYYNYIPNQVEPATTLTPSGTTGVITLTAGASAFVAGDVNQYVESYTAGGKCRILEFISVTEVRAKIEIPFYSTDEIADGDWFIDRGYEPMWSATRGWSSCGTFHEGRLYMAGFKSRPNTLCGSVVQDFFNFSEGSLFDDEAIVRTLSSDQLNKIVNLKSDRTLIPMTTGGEWTNKVVETITPTNVNFVRATTYGSKEGTRVYENEGFNIFVQRGGSNVLGLIFEDTRQNYIGQPITLYNSHLLNNPVSVALRKPISTDDAAQYYIVNEDGSLIIGTIYTTQKIGSFFRSETDGLYKAVAVDDQDIYVVVEREIDGETKHYLEVLTNEYNTDSCAVFTDTTTTITGLDHLEGKTVKVIADDSMLSDEVVTDGEITIDREATKLEVGLDFKPYIKTLPIEIPKFGTWLGKRKRIFRMDMRLFETGSLTINGKNIVSFRGFGPAGAGSPLDQAPPEFTGEKELTGLLGWNKLGQIEITQDDPRPLTVLAFAIGVK